VIEALEAEGVTGLAGGYTNIHLLPMYQQKIAYGSQGFPWTSEICQRDVSYDKGICPVAERLHEETFLCLPMCLHDLSNNDVDLIIDSFCKVWNHFDSLLQDEVNY
jgi:dTDP-4-amino-4,6-dideoxygalactose transaminase